MPPEVTLLAPMKQEHDVRSESTLLGQYCPKFRRTGGEMVCLRAHRITLREGICLHAMI